jgi:hypothetical protein
MRPPDRAHPDRQPGHAADERAGRSCVVEVDVREQQMSDVRERETVPGEPRLERVERGRRPAVEQRRAVGRVDQIHTDRVR